MSLEDAINRNSDLLEKNNTLLEQLVSKANAAAAAKGADAGDSDKPATRTRKPKEDKAAETEASGNTVATVKPKVGAWLGEFPKDDPETKRRGAALQKALEKIGEKSISGITDQANIDRVAAWIEKRVAEGRVEPEWSPEEASTGEDDDI